MKKLILYTISFLILLYLLDKTWLFALSHNLNLKTTYISKGKIDAQILILGPCTSLWMMEPDTFKKYTGLKTYNLSTSNSNLAENYAMLYLYLQHNKAPQHLFLALNHESFDKSINLFNTWQFAHLMEDTLVSNIIKKEDSRFYSRSHIPFIKYAWYNRYSSFAALQGLKHYFTNKAQSYHPDGFELPVNNSWDGSFEKFTTQYPKGKKYGWDTEPESYCRKIIRLAKAKGIKVTLYDSPVYQAAMPYYLNRKEIQEKTASLAKEEGVAYWQFESLKFMEEKSNFITPINTTREGSAKFMYELMGR